MTEKRKKPALNKAQEKALSMAIDYKATFGSDHGKRVLDNLMMQNHVFHGTFDSDAMKMAFQEGQRSVVMAIMSQINVDVDRFRTIFENQAAEQFQGV